MNTNDTKEKKKPVHEARIGMVKAAVWGNMTRQGLRYGVTVTRLYKDGEKWKNTNTFGRDDLLTLRKVLDDAHSWIHKQVKHITPDLPVPADMNA